MNSLVRRAGGGWRIGFECLVAGVACVGERVAGVDAVGFENGEAW